MKSILRIWSALAIALETVAIPHLYAAEEGDPVRELYELDRRLPKKEMSLLKDEKPKETPAEPIAIPKQEPPSDNVFRGVRTERNDPFVFPSVDGRFTLRIIGLIQGDYRAYLNGPDTTDIDSFVIPRARLGAEAILFESFLFRFVPEFGLNQARLLDGYGEVRFDPTFNVRIGRYRQPNSYEQYAITVRRAPFLERSILNQVGTGRDVGLLVYGDKAFQDRLDYAVSLTNGINPSDIDGDDRKELVGRLAVRPFNSDTFPQWIHRFQVGIAGTTDVNQIPVTPTSLRTPFGVTWLQFKSGVVLDGLRNRLSPEMAYFCGPFGIAAQALFIDQEMRAPSSGSNPTQVVDVPLRGFYVMSSYLLTGEERTGYDVWIDPRQPVDPKRPGSGYGAIEIMSRIERLDIGRVVFTPGRNQLADPALYSSGCTDLTLGLNWYLNRFSRLSLHWEHSWFDDPVRFSSRPGGFSSSQDTVVTRFQLTF